MSATPIRRRFMQVRERRVHYLRSGEGPPAVLVHSSPANAWLLRPEIERLSRDYTVFAFDTPGFGLSDALPGETLTVADLADALAQTLSVVGMPACPMFGSHTGAAIALEFGVRHPDRITGLVLDGVPIFTAAEQADLFGEYFRKLPVSDLGGQYALAWTRFRDQSVWFPWSHRRPDHLNAYDLGAPESTHMWVSMFFEAQHKYAPAYAAALFYGERAVDAAAALTLPVIYTATDTDMLFPHMDRLPPLKPGQEIRHIGRSYEAKRELIAEGFKRFGGALDAPADQAMIASTRGVARQFTDRSDDPQDHLRTAGDRNAHALLILHDTPGSAAALEPLIEALSKKRFVIAPDLPGSGESEPLEAATPTIADYAAWAIRLLDDLGVEEADVLGIGFGASVALELAIQAPERVPALALEGLLLPEADERAELKLHYAPPIAVEPDGAHWYRTWLMLRDSLVWWPWYDRRDARLRRAPADFSAEPMHRWTLDVMRRRETYGQVIAAALDHDAAAALARVVAPMIRLTGGSTPLSAYEAAFARLAPGAAQASAQGDAVTRALALFSAPGWDR